MYICIPGPPHILEAVYTINQPTDQLTTRAQYEIKNYVPAALHLTELSAAGRIAHIGTTNFDVPRLEEMVGAGVPIASVQVCVRGTPCTLNQ